MEEDYRQYTVTMAKVLAGQGHWDKAAEIYRHLLRREGDRPDLEAALAEAETRARAAADKTAEDLAPLFERWLELLTRRQRIRSLRRLLGRLKPGPGRGGAPRSA